MTLKLMNSYFQRKQYVLINNIESKLQSNNYGVPQGSTLGPLLFLLYINDIGNATHSIPRLFADDACFLLNHSNLTTLNTELKLELTEVFKWCSANKLTINPNKCHCMIIPPSTKDFTLDFTLKIDNTIVPSNETVKYLGVIIDSKLSFAPHIKYLESKLSRANGIISRLKSTLPNDALLKLYYALFQPHLLYGLTIWGSPFPTYLNPIKTLQNRAVKNIGSGSMYDNSNPCYVRFNILKLQDLYIVETAKIVYNYIHRPSMLPPLFSITSIGLI